MTDIDRPVRERPEDRIFDLGALCSLRKLAVVVEWVLEPRGMKAETEAGPGTQTHGFDNVLHPFCRGKSNKHGII